jgi:hypothetical protein
MALDTSTGAPSTARRTCSVESRAARSLTGEMNVKLQRP